ncbi:MAG: DUF4239 domain-containing protein [Anaerolineales bacterium]
MKSVLIKSFLFAILATSASYLSRSLLHTELFLTDIGGLSAFLTVFGTLYGILTAFVVFEVWSQYNHVSELIDKEAQGLERLYRLTLYFRDDQLTSRMKTEVSNYAHVVIEGKFEQLGSGKRRTVSGLAFRKLFEIIRDIEFDDDHDSIVFDQILEHYGNLGQIRTERLNQSLRRLPSLLKSFIYFSSFFALVTFLFMPFAQPYYAYLSVMAIGFLLAMIFQMIEDLDNPFLGHWNLTPEPFARALKHIEEDYS